MRRPPLYWYVDIASAADCVLTWEVTSLFVITAILTNQFEGI